MANKKLVDLDNLDKLSKSLDARYKGKIQEESERAMFQEQILGTEINVTKDMLGGKSIRYITQAEYDNLSESEKNSTTVAYFITDAEDLSHEHENKDFLDNLSAINIAIGNKVQTFDGANDLSYSISDIGAAPINHAHDDKYYTETEIDGMIENVNDNTAMLEADINITKNMFGGRSIRYITQAEYDQLSDAEKNSTTVAYFITDAKDVSHEHENKDFLDNLAARNIAIGNKVQTFDGAHDLSYSISDIGAAPASHTHDDRYYTETEINTKIADINETINTKEATLQANIDGKAPSSHTHDDRYYTESEMNTKLAAKADTNHGTHVPTPQTANNAKFLRNDNSWQTVTPANIGAAESSHNHNDSYYTKTEINTEIDNINETINTKEAALQASINGKAPSSHNHDDRYYTETEMDGKLKTITDSISSNVSTLNNSIATAKAGAISESKSYTNTAIANLVDSAPEAMNTLNELAEAISNHKDDYEAYVSTVSSSIATAKAEAIAEAAKKDTALHTTISAEIDADIKVEKERAEAAEAALQTAIDKKAPSSHTHDDRYYTESEINTKLAAKADSSHGNHVPATQTASNKTFLRNDNTWATVTPANIGAAPSSHTHDDRYYTETEVNGLIEDVNETINTNVATLTTEVNKKLNKSDHGAHLALGTTSSTAFRGDYGNTAYNHSQAAHAPVNAQKNSDITKAEIEAKLTGSITSHNHNGQYYTEAEINGKIEDINETINTKEATLQANIDGKANSNHGNHVAYGTCATAAATAEKAVSVSDSNWKLTTGCIVAIKFTASNTAGNVKLNVNSSGAYPIWYNNAEYTGTGNTYTGYANRIITYMFNGTHWVWISGGYDANNTYSNASLGQGYVTCDTAESTVAKVGTLSSYALTTGGVVSVKFTYNVPASATLNINSKGAKAIYFRGAAITANIIKAGDIATFIYNGSQYQLISIDRWQNDIANHNHDGRYYTETEINTKISDINNTISSEVATLTAEVNKKLNISDHGTHLALGTTSSTAFRGDYGNTAYNHSQAAHAPSNAQKNSDITKAEIEAKLTGSITSHNHNGQYYTEAEINGKIEDINETISEKEAALQASINGKAPSSHGSHVAYGTCATAAATAEKIVSVSDTSWKLTTGCIVAVKFSATNSAGSVTLNVNSTGAYPIWQNNAAYTGTSSKYTGYANRVLTYMFNGTHWVWISGGIDDNSTYSNASLGQGYATCDTAESTVAKVGTLSSYSLQPGGVVSVKFTYKVPASATLNINSKGAKAIYFRGAAITANIIKAGDIATFMYNGSQYQLISIDRWQNDITSHNHDTSYYTKANIDTKIENINNTISSEVATLNAEVAKKANENHGTHLTLGTGAGNAYYGDKGREAYDHSQTAHAPSNAQKNSDITKAEIENKLTGDITSHKHTIVSMQAKNTKEGLDLPSTYPEGVTYFLSSNPTNRFNNIQYGTVETIRELNGATAAWQFLYPYNAKTDKFYVRNAQYNTDEWREWAEVYTSINKPAVNDLDNTIVTKTVSNAKLTLGKEKRQYCASVPSGTTIVFPSTTAFLEINLYFATSGDMSLNFPDNTKWRIDPNIETASAYLLTATYVNSTIGWMAEVKGFTA